MNQSNSYRKPTERALSPKEQQMETLRLQVAELEAQNQKLERELVEREEAMQSLFSFFQDRGAKVEKM
jgi:chromosome segregation ATPase